MIAPEVLFCLGPLPLQQLLLLGSEMAHLPLLGALVSGAQSFDCGAASGWLANGWLGETDSNDCRRPEKDKALTAHKEPPASERCATPPQWQNEHCRARSAPYVDAFPSRAREL